MNELLVKTKYLYSQVLTPSTRKQTDLPPSEYGVGSIVKLIDSKKHHSSWATLEVVETFQNKERYRTTQSSLSETDWYYGLAIVDGNIQLFVSEIEICDSQIPWDIGTD